MLDLTDILIASLVLCVAAIGVLAYMLHRKGVPTAALAKQTELKAGGYVDELEDRVLAIMARADAKRGMRAAYFDVDDFLADLGRLPTSYAPAVRLDGAIKRNGDSPGVDYVTDPTTRNVILK